MPFGFDALGWPGYCVGELGPWERLEVRVVGKNNKQTLCRRGSDLGRKGVGESFPGSSTG